MDVKAKERVDDHDFNKNMKSIIVRDLFPELKTGQDDETINRFNLTTYCQNYISKEAGDFVDSVETDRMLLRSAAPQPKINNDMQNTQFIPWENPRFNALFYQPQEIDQTSKLALQYNKKKRPRINYEMTRFPDRFNSMLSEYSPYHPFTTESSTTESESEFEGRSTYRNQLLQNPQPVPAKQIRKDRLEKIRKRNELSEKGKELFKTLEEQP